MHLHISCWDIASMPVSLNQEFYLISFLSYMAINLEIGSEKETKIKFQSIESSDEFV